MVVPPAAGGQAFQLQVGIHISQIPPAPLNVSAVVEYGQAGLYPVYGLAHFGGIACVDSLAQLQGRTVIHRIFSLCQKFGRAVLAVALAHAHDIQENSVRVILAHHLLNLEEQIVQVGRVEAKQMVMGRGKIRNLKFPSGFPYMKPLRMAQRRLFIEACGEIHRGAHPDLVSRLYLCPQQVET